MKKVVEILAPAGSLESMRAAVAAGADAVYIGGSRFGARAFANNLDEETMLGAIDYVHLHGCRIYMTVNTLVKEGELAELVPYLRPYVERGLDAVIVQDMGVFAVVRKAFPELPIHASTQMTITNPQSAKRMMELGASRVVTARELSLEEIWEIYDQTGIEIESFVHGALCYCYSGQCLFSSLIGGRSGNRGRCAQTCRLPFEVKQDNRTLNKKDEKYVLSLKDLCTLDLIPDLVEAGVYSMKIEGRMKSPRYTAGVVSIYRKYVDRFLKHGRKGYYVEEADRKILLELFDRGGQTDGYYTRHNGRDMVAMKEKPAFRQENKELSDYLDKTYVEAAVREPVAGHVVIREGEAAKLSLSCRETLVSVSGAVVQTAKNQPMTEERIIKQIGKTGNTPFVFEEITAEVKGAPFLPLQELNELRRSGLELLQEELLKPYRRSVPVCAQTEHGFTKESVPQAEQRPVPASARPLERYSCLSVSLEEPAQLQAALTEPSVGEIYLDSAGFDAETWSGNVKKCHKAGKKCLLTLPHIFRQEAEQYFEGNLSRFLDAGFDGAMVRDWGEIPIVRQWDPEMPLVMDYGIYTMNQEAEAMIRKLAGQGDVRFTLPVELNSRELEQKGAEGRELIVYGRIPVMVTAQCMKRTVDRCTKKPELLYLKDRMAKEFPVKNHCRFCYNTIYNTSPLSLLKDKSMVDRLAPGRVRLNFTTEDGEAVHKVVRAFAFVYLPEFQTAETELAGDYTRGHFKRGIE